jgi:putative permease
MIDLVRRWLARHFSDPERVILGLMVLVGIGLVYFVGSLLTPVFVSIIIAYLLDDLVEFCLRLRLPRLVAVIIVFLGFIIGMIVIILWLLPLTFKQISQLIQQLPMMLTTAQRELAQLPTAYPDLISENQVRQINEILNDSISSLGRQVLSFSLASVMGLFYLVVYLILVPLMVFFLLKDKLSILAWFRRFMPGNMDLTQTVWQEANLQVSNYIRGKGLEIIIVWVVSYIAFQILGLQFALVISMFVGLSVIIPYFGVTVIGFVMALAAFVQWGWGSQFIWAIAIYAIIQILDGNLLAPLLLSGVVHLHPVAIVAAILLFGGLWGVWGLFFAIPLATLINAVLKAWFAKLDLQSESPALTENGNHPT